MSSGTFLKGGLRAGVQENLPPQKYYQPNQEEGFLPKLGRNIATSAIKAIEYPLGAIGNIQKMTQAAGFRKPIIELPTVEDVQKYIEPKLEKHLPEGYLKPRNKYEEGLHEVLQTLPIALATGTGSLLSKLGSFGASALASKGVEKLGGGPVTQMAAGYAAGRIPRLVGKGLSAKALVNKAETEYKQDYKLAEDNLKKMGNPSFKSEQFDNDMREITKRYNDLLPKTQRAVRPQLQHLLSKVDEGEMSIAKAWDLEKQFGKEARFQGKSGNIQDFYKLVRNKLSNFVDEAAQAKPEFGEPYLRATDKYKGFKAQEEIGDILKSPKGLELLDRAAKSTKALLSGNLKGSVMHMVSKDYAHNRAIAEELMSKSKTIQKYVSEIKNDAYLGDKVAVLAKMHQLDNEMKQEEFKMQKGRFVKGGLKKQ